MATTIAIVTGTADRRGPRAEGTFGDYPVIPGRFDSIDMVCDGNTPIFETMMCLADGSVSMPFGDDALRSNPAWTDVKPNWVAGTTYNTATASYDRIAVIDLDNADGREVLRVINWINHVEDARLPE